MLRHGTTTVEAKSGYGLTTEDEVKCLRVIQQVSKSHPVDVVPTFLGAHAVPPEFEKNSEDYVELIVKEMIPSIASARLAEFCDVFCEKGAFTGAAERRDGKFLQADGGTFFLDEIGDMSLRVQTKVLRVLQDGEFQRVGGKETLKTDVRIIAATNKDLPLIVILS